MIKVKNSELNQDTIESINAFISMEIDATCAFRISKIIKDLSPIVDSKTETETNLIKKWAIKDDDGNIVQGTDENGQVIEGSFKVSDPEGYRDEYSEFLGYVNELNHNPIKFDDLRLDKVSTQYLMKIGFLFE